MRKPTLKPAAGNREELLERRVADLERLIRRLPVRDVAGGALATTFFVNKTSHGLAVKDVVRHNGTDWTKSKADTAANAVVGGMVIAVPSPDVFVVATPGSYVRGLSGLTAGSVHYLDASTAGALTTTAPTIAVPVLHADSTTSGVLMAALPAGTEYTGPKRCTITWDNSTTAKSISPVSIPVGASFVLDLMWGFTSSYGNNAYFSALHAIVRGTILSSTTWSADCIASGWGWGMDAAVPYPAAADEAAASASGTSSLTVAVGGVTSNGGQPTWESGTITVVPDFASPVTGIKVSQSGTLFSASGYHEGVGLLASPC